MEKIKKEKYSNLVKWFVISTFVSLYLIVSIISTIHVIDFFQLSNFYGLSVALAIAFEIGAAASLASIIVLEKMNKFLIWSLFCVLTLVQMMGNSYYAFTHLENFSDWINLFGLNKEPVIVQKRILSIISGGILPLVALGFIKSLVDYIRPSNKKNISNEKSDFKEVKKQEELIEFKDEVKTQKRKTAVKPKPKPKTKRKTTVKPKPKTKRKTTVKPKPKITNPKTEKVDDLKKKN